MEVIALIALIVTIAILAILLVYYSTKLRFERRFRQWQEAQWQEWAEERERAVKEALSQSRAVLGGKFTEQLAPYLPEFNYDPTEARFIGSPIDLIIFPGLAKGEPEEIVIMEIKTGKTAQLTPQERKIRELIENGMVRWELLQRPQEEY
ncbi:MAG TPA: Holliday junction resolvase [Dehalococcoidia bacterium]|jgi:predicted Holliday junction resolvase-like endonuclease|nr:Holliday junction resolvase [Dehalococcoidia bacterium]